MPVSLNNCYVPAVVGSDLKGLNPLRQELKFHRRAGSVAMNYF
jgi:hypothetical protein